ncbi:AMP binding protein [Phlegmacium glaucopus]|nr:AMP binding protein [Phlegmacium glaucopus]
MAPRIYTSPLPSVPLFAHSLFTHLFSSPGPNDIGGFHASLPAFIDTITGTTITRAQLRHLALSFGYGLQNHPVLSAKRGDTVMIYSHNSLAWPVVLFGSVAAGLRCTLANSAYNARELAFQYTDSRARLIFTSEDGCSTVQETLKSLGFSQKEANERIIVMTNGLEWAGGPAVSIKPDLAHSLKMTDLLELGTLKGEERFDGEKSNETVYLCYSSGTTGKPKGVETTHRNISSVLDMASPLWTRTGPDDTYLGILPFYHIYGAVNLLLFPFKIGLSVAIMQRFDPVQFCANIERYKITCSLVVPPVLVVLARHPAVDQYDMSSLRILFSGAAPLSATLAQQVITRFSTKRKGKDPMIIAQGYGLTETSPNSHMLSGIHSVRKVGSIGVLLPNLEARLLLDGDGDGNLEAGEGEAGELWMRGPTIMKGYLNNAKATQDAITPDGWFKTGDIAIRDPEGFYYIVDRRKELIKYKGVLLTHPDIADAAVIGVHSAKEATELPRAYVVPARPDGVKAEADIVKFAENIKAWIQTKVARHKFLRGGIVVTDVIPKSAAGKILRRELRDRAKEELAGKDPHDDHISAKL